LAESCFVGQAEVFGWVGRRLVIDLPHEVVIDYSGHIANAGTTINEVTLRCRLSSIYSPHVRLALLQHLVTIDL
jgi:hypothetical protein